jgi:hypothetical protein
MDLATGTAGVLFALAAAASGEPFPAPLLLPARHQTPAPTGAGR